MLPHSTPVPNALFDVHLRDLQTTELKVLLVVIRQTLGWSDKRNAKVRKEKDWIAGSQLRLKTGCSRRAITTATELLVSKQLVEVLSDNGYPLRLPSQRKGKTRLYYRLAPPFYVHLWKTRG